MKIFCERNKISEEIYEELRKNILEQKSPAAVKKFRDLSGFGLVESSSILYKEFSIEKRFSYYEQVYNSYQKVEKYFENGNSEINSDIGFDIGILLEFVKEQLSK